MSGTKCCIKQQEQRDNEGRAASEGDKGVGVKKKKKKKLKVCWREDGRGRQPERWGAVWHKRPGFLSHDASRFRFNDISFQTCRINANFGVVFIWVWAYRQETSNTCTRRQWNGPSVLQCSRHLLCRQWDNPPETKGFPVSQIIIIRDHTHFLHPGRRTNCRGKRLTRSHCADPGPVFTLSSGLTWRSESWLSVWVNKSHDSCELTGQRSSYSIRGVKPMMTYVFLALCHIADTNMSWSSVGKRYRL